MEASAAQRNANQFRRGAAPPDDGTLPAAGEGRSGASVSSAPPPASGDMTTALARYFGFSPACVALDCRLLDAYRSSTIGDLKSLAAINYGSKATSKRKYPWAMATLKASAMKLLRSLLMWK